MFSRKKSNQINAFLFITMLLLIMSCNNRPDSDLASVSVIPKPLSVTATGGYFELTAGTPISFQGKEAERIAGYLAERLNPSTGFNLSPAASDAATGIQLAIAGNADAGDEGYLLEITEDFVKISAPTPAGLFFGVQTLLQLFPATILEKNVQQGKWEIPTGTISDRPEFGYRGMMLDVSRHFFTVEEVKGLIDHISNYKLNMLHLHLSDDQGWRIEIKSWPKLTEIGGSLEVGGGPGGFYTQEQYSDIVRYAADRFITIVPEIDMPGHTNAALASYPELNCDNKAPELYTGTEVGFSSLCTRKEITYKFIDDVVREISALTPGPFFHMGGDESHSTKKEDYIPFVERVQDIIASHGKRVLGWDDIAISTLKPGTVAQFWANVKNANMAVEKGAKILISPAVKAYIDMQYDSTTKLGLHWAAYIEVDSAYTWDPATYSKGIGKEDIIGVEAPLWAETLTNLDEIEYMAFPRLPGIAEIAWTPSSLRNWEEYRNRLADHGPRFSAMGIDFYRSPKVEWKE